MKKIILLSCLVVGLVGCDKIKSLFGMGGKSAPDAAGVQQAAPSASAGLITGDKCPGDKEPVILEGQCEGEWSVEVKVEPTIDVCRFNSKVVTCPAGTVALNVREACSGGFGKRVKRGAADTSAQMCKESYTEQMRSVLKDYKLTCCKLPD